MLFHFLSRPFPFPRSPWLAARLREEEEKEGESQRQQGILGDSPLLSGSIHSLLSISKCRLQTGRLT